MKPFQHRHAGHCESGVTAALLSHYGLPISEPMVFGLSSALMFGHFPFIRVGGIALTSYRMPPGAIYKRLCKVTGVKMVSQRFRDPQSATAALDKRLASGDIAALQSSVYWLPYFPPDMRFHFNAHNLVVYGREDDTYLISDPVFEAPQQCARQDLEIARFTRGKFAPQGLMYFPVNVPTDFDLPTTARKAIKRTCRIMLGSPLPFVGVRGIRYLGQKLRKMETGDPRLAKLLVSSVIRMQEEIGTGGGGFRFMYAAFLQELAEKLDDALLTEAEQMMTQVGNDWRLFALDGARYCRKKGDITLRDLEARLMHCAQGEDATFRLLQRYGKPAKGL